jgi:hypothetical protein
VSTLLFEQQDQGYIYKVVLSNDHQYKVCVQGLQSDLRRAYRISRKLYDEIMTADELDRLQVAKSIYNSARLKKKAR